ncbi:MAG: prolyl aminopeptidase [Devosia sp.]|uniref:prolyl aminopeptidase n=1 Tax=Devosia sp. TaxID=1871048 RepID=UPI001AC70BF1|nr:prolyl aminopeptidase [Devosia sp.]MBN9317481.1 prolyl aminopeptidase [Devosia sp.]
MPLDDTNTSLVTFRLPVGDGHELYVETVGRPTGIPVVFLHGGPGSGCQPSHRQLFDPERHYAVLFDQRGAGRSTPHGSRHANTTQHLIADMEAIRTRLGIDKWLVVGGSWGATLGLAYAEAHPGHVSGIVLRATFLGTADELDWSFGTAPRTFYPALYDDFLSLLDGPERDDPLRSYFARILAADPVINAPAARAYAATEETLASIRPEGTRLDLATVNDPAARTPPSAYMEAHYFSNDCFLAPDQLLANAHRLAGIPGVIVQGQYDLLCPPRVSASLAAQWPDAKVVTVPSAGHLLGDPGITDAVKAAIAELT